MLMLMSLNFDFFFFFVSIRTHHHTDHPARNFFCSSLLIIAFIIHSNSLWFPCQTFIHWFFIINWVRFTIPVLLIDIMAMKCRTKCLMLSFVCSTAYYYFMACQYSASFHLSFFHLYCSCSCCYLNWVRYTICLWCRRW